MIEPEIMNAAMAAWNEMDHNERVMVQFGIVPAGVANQIEAEVQSHYFIDVARKLTLALMDCAVHEH